MSQAAIIVASSDQSARAGADIIRAGGNVIDAAIAAAFATSAGEPSITSLAGGAVMVHRDASRGTVEIYDLFSNAPGLGKTAGAVDFSGVDIYFPEGDTTQTFHIGRGAAAVPATLGGLCNILHKRGRLELGEEDASREARSKPVAALRSEIASCSAGDVGAEEAPPCRRTRAAGACRAARSVYRGRGPCISGESGAAARALCAAPTRRLKAGAWRSSR